MVVDILQLSIYEISDFLAPKQFSKLAMFTFIQKSTSGWGKIVEKPHNPHDTILGNMVQHEDASSMKLTIKMGRMSRNHSL